MTTKDRTKDRRPCVVVVEEHEDSRRAMQRALAANGYDVKCAGTVKEAIYIVERYGCDLLISDMLLPDGTAVELLRSLADVGETPKAIAMTDNTSFKDQADAAKAGCIAFVSKPVMFTQLLTEVDRALAH
jgi:DNA-binding NtrC family response regulator